MFKHNCLLGLRFVLVTLILTLGIRNAYSYPQLIAGHLEEASIPSKEQLCRTIAKSFLDSSNFLKCLSRQQSATCDPISQLYRATDLQVDEIKGLDNNTLTKDNLFSFIGTTNENLWKRLRNIPSQCAGLNFDCSSQNDKDFPMPNNVPQEIIEMMKHLQRAGTLMMNVLDNNPNDLTLNAIEDILDKCVIGVHKNTLGSQTSLGLILSQMKVLNNDMEALVSGHSKPKVLPSKQEFCHTIATSFVDFSNYLKCLSRQQSATCDAINLFYQAVDLNVKEIKRLDDYALTKDNLFNFLSSFNEGAWKRLLNIPSQCAVQNFDCSSQDTNDLPMHSTIPQEIIEMIEHTLRGGSLMLSLLDNKPDDLTVNAIEDILDKFVIGVNRNAIGSQTSVGAMLSQIKVVSHDMEALVSGHLKSKVIPSKPEFFHTIATSFVDFSNYLKCLSKQKSASCDPISLFYQSMDINVDEIKRLDKNALTKDNLFNFLGTFNEGAWKRLRNIPSECAVHNFDCSSQDNKDLPMPSTIPLEIIETIEHTLRGGSLMLSLLDNNPDDLTLNAIEDILHKCIIGVNRNAIGSQTSVGTMLSQFKVLSNDMEALVSEHLKPKVLPSKEQLIHTIAKSFLDSSNFLKCLSRQQSATCGPIRLFYQAMDIEVDEIKGLDNNTLTKDSLFNFVGTTNENSWKRLRNIPSQCAGHNFDCSSQNDKDFPMPNNVPQEIIEMIENLQRAGTLMMSLLDNNPDDLTLNTIEDILGKCVIGIHKNTLGSQTSIGLISSQIKVLNNDMEALVAGHLKPKVIPSKQELWQTIAKSFVDFSHYLKCLSRQQPGNCDPISLFYKAMDLNVDEIKSLDDTALTKDNLFNFLGTFNENIWKRLRNIPSQCAVDNFDCSSQDKNNSSMLSNIPQEIIEMIEHTLSGGSLMLKLLDTNPDDLTVNAIEDSFDKSIIGVHRNAIGSQTSVGLMLSQIKVLSNDMEALVSRQFKPAPQASTSKQEFCHTIATSFVDFSNYLKCLSRQQSGTCDPVTLFYKAMDLNVDEIKSLHSNALTKDNLFNFLGTFNENAWKRLRNIPSQCAVQNFDCSSLDSNNLSMHSNIPQEIIEMIENTRRGGSLMLSLLDKNPDDLTVNAIEDILDMCIIGVHRNAIGSQTSVGLMLSQMKKVASDMETLVAEQFKPTLQAPTSKLQKCQQIATLFVDGGKILKCLTRPQFSSCNATGQFYQAIEFEINGLKQLADSALTKENLFNYLGSHAASALEHLLEIPSKCLGHSFDCSQDDYYPSIENNIPQEVIDCLEQMQLAGNLVLQLLDKHPDDMTSNAIEDILSNYLLDIHKSNTTSGTSLSLLLPHVAKVIANLQKLDSVPKQLEEFQTIGKGFVESASRLKCLTQEQFSTCDSVKEIYNALDAEVYAAKHHNEDTRSIDRTAKYVEHRFPTFNENLQEIIIKCTGKRENQCHQHQHERDPNVKIPQEVQDFIEQFHQAGKGIGRLLEKTPSDFVLKSVAEILGYLLHEVQHSDTANSTSLSIVLGQSKIMNQKLQKLEQAIA